jgi:aryl-phospho-beta-D-glucosidase BglC (GH1 family)
MFFSRFLRPMLFVFLAIFILFAPSLSSAQDQGLAFQRAKALKRGINLSMWFAQTSDYSPKRLNSYTTEADFALVASLHFDHVRLSIDPAPLLKEPVTNGLNADHLALLDKAVNGLLAHHLAVIIDIHPGSSYKKAINSDDAALDRFCSLWSTLAAHYAKLDPNRVFFEIMNEPETETTERVTVIENRAIAAIRSAAPQNTILAGGAFWSGLGDLLRMKPFEYPNIIYNFHYYDPMTFTHQGANWVKGYIQQLRGIPYPSTPENIKGKLSLVPNLLDQLWLENYGLESWNATHIAGQIVFAKKWGDGYNVPVYCGEFGAYRAFSDPVSRAAWIHDTRVALEANGIGWAMWDYQDNFGVVTKKDGITTVDRSVTDALGLKR